MSQKEINNNLITYFAQTNYRNKMQKFGIRQIDRRRHFYILGKSRLLKGINEQKRLNEWF